MLLAHSRDQPLPETHRLGVRVVDTEDLHPVINPVSDNTQDLARQTFEVVVEVQRIDVVVFLRRVLGVCDRAVDADTEPLRVFLHPRVIGRALQRQIERDLETVVVRGRDKGVEVFDRAEVRMNGVVATVG